jgi:hypothetical protein
VVPKITQPLHRPITLNMGTQISSDPKLWNIDIYHAQGRTLLSFISYNITHKIPGPSRRRAVCKARHLGPGSQLVWACSARFCAFVSQPAGLPHAGWLSQGPGPRPPFSHPSFCISAPVLGNLSSSRFIFAMLGSNMPS